jgi:hypothetical protein
MRFVNLLVIFLELEAKTIENCLIGVKHNYLFRIK